MSVYCISWVFQHAGSRLGDRLVHLALADYAHDDGVAWPSYETLAKKARLSRRQAMRACANLEEAGYTTRLGVTERGTVRWQMLMDPEQIEAARKTCAWAKAQRKSVENAGDNTSLPPGQPSDKCFTEARDKSFISPDDLSPKPLVEPLEQQPLEQQLRHSPKNGNGNSRIEGAQADAPPSMPPLTEADHERQQVQRVFDHWVAAVNPGRKNLSPSRERLLKKAVREAGAVLCMKAVDGMVAYQRNRGGSLQLSRCLATHPNSGPLGETIEFWASQAPEVSRDGGVTKPTIPVGLSAMFASRVSGQLEELRIADKSTSWAAIQRGKDAEAWFASKGFQVSRRPDGSPYIEAIEEEVGA